ncbi:hypothetical protein KIN20_005612 [Parelaphostrongylus tenuis]|uniref:Uncharacterized protein n=1 Tax=Parelaphostrongylus tenuis TaxID=148309 RepID=A0AAD5QFA8_PARTN|nr:hypothetical protein KIN20_005612 [Parelaphostrongylus tenuis]
MYQNDLVEPSREGELDEYFGKLLKVSDKFGEQCTKGSSNDRYEADGRAKIRNVMPPENVLKCVEYEEPPRGIEAETLIDVMRRLHSLTAVRCALFSSKYTSLDKVPRNNFALEYDDTIEKNMQCIECFMKAIVCLVLEIKQLVISTFLWLSISNAPVLK